MKVNGADCEVLRWRVSFTRKELDTLGKYPAFQEKQERELKEEFLRQMIQQPVMMDLIKVHREDRDDEISQLVLTMAVVKPTKRPEAVPLAMPELPEKGQNNADN